jgi:hypothetical protein
VHVFYYAVHRKIVLQLSQQIPAGQMLYTALIIPDIWLQPRTGYKKRLVLCHLPDGSQPMRPYIPGFEKRHSAKVSIARQRWRRHHDKDPKR